MKPVFLWHVGLVIFMLFVFESRSMGKDASSLPFTIAKIYTVSNKTIDSLSGPIPGQKPTTRKSFELTRDAKKAYFFYWDGPPFRDLGPMSELESWKTDFMSGEARVTKTKMFMGQKQEVLVLHHKLTKTERLMVYSKDMDRDEFHELLRSIRPKRE